MSRCYLTDLSLQPKNTYLDLATLLQIAAKWRICSVSILVSFPYSCVTQSYDLYPRLIASLYRRIIFIVPAQVIVAHSSWSLFVIYLPRYPPHPYVLPASILGSSLKSDYKLAFHLICASNSLPYRFHCIARWKKRTILILIYYAFDFMTWNYNYCSRPL